MTIEWVHVIIALGGVLAGVVSGLVAGVWRVARIEHDIRREFTQEIAEVVHAFETRMTDIADQFDETLKGLRQKINDVELETQKHFVSKPEFDDFRREYREDMRDLKHSIAELRNKH